MTGTAAVLSSSLVAVGCGSDLDEAGGSDAPLPEVCVAAQDQGSVVWYSATGDNINVPVAEAFENEVPGVRVEILRQASGQLQTRYAQEREANVQSADVITMSASEDWFVGGVETAGSRESWICRPLSTGRRRITRTV